MPAPAGRSRAKGRFVSESGKPSKEQQRRQRQRDAIDALAEENERLRQQIESLQSEIAKNAETGV